MLAALALLLTTPLQDVRTVELSDGATVPVQAGSEALAYRYWSCADTFIDALSADENFGGSLILQGGPSRTILIRFGDLNRAANGYRKVRSAKIVLTTSGGGTLPELKAARRLLAPWGEGPISVMQSTPDKKTPAWSATWKSRRANPDGIDWQTAGAAGAADSEPVEAAANLSGGQVEIVGIESTIQAMLDRWYDNHGIALQFETPIDFMSSEAPRGRPKLVLELEKAAPPTGADLSVTMIERKADQFEPFTGRPRDGQNVTYVAHVKNVGDAPAQPFKFAWVVKERTGSTSEVSKSLAPGESTTVETRRPYRFNKEDHRLQPIGLRIAPQGTDASASNDYLEIQESAPGVFVHIPAAVAQAAARGENVLGSRSLEDAVQEQFRIMNDVLLAESRFSIAPQGVLERFAVASIVVGNSPEDGPRVRAGYSDRSPVARLLMGSGTGMQASLAESWGIQPLASMHLRPRSLDGATQDVELRDEGSPISRGALDRFAGLMGGGSTMNDGAVLSAIALPYEPVFSPVFENLDPESTGLFAATDVAEFQRRLSISKQEPSAMKLPTTVVLRAMDMNGGPLREVELDFFQSVGGKIPDAPPVLTLKTTKEGSALLSSRSSGPTSGPPDPFGGLKPDGSNGVYLVRARQHAATEWAWLKAWHMADAVARTGRPLAIMELRFNLPNAPIDTVNHAENKIVQDSIDTPPARLTRLVDAKTDTEIELPNEKAAWIEIDLGRDRALTEVSLLTRSLAFWQGFEISTYMTGDSPTAARVWSRELDWRWSSQNRRDLEAPGLAVMRYRGPQRRARFIRITCVTPGAEAKLAEIRVFAAKAAGQG